MLASVAGILRFFHAIPPPLLQGPHAFLPNATLSPFPCPSECARERTVATLPALLPEPGWVFHPNSDLASLLKEFAVAAEMLRTAGDTGNGMWQALADEEHTLTCEDLSVGLRKLVYSIPSSCRI
jgi:hypothetical protein